ncbi:hypothetical protein A4G31_01035 [Mycobacterium persicum]|nr:hypothetical protein A4G31_01035 [Mycobacterium persicum]
MWCGAKVIWRITMSLKFGRSAVMSYARRSTREALRRVALKTFARKGFANVTVPSWPGRPG